jgi:hypothetical protein
VLRLLDPQGVIIDQDLDGLCPQRVAGKSVLMSCWA